MGEGRQSGRRVTVDEAARHLGLTVDAVRKRVQRGQIAYKKDEAGRVRIILDEDETLQDDRPDTTGQDAGVHAELVEELRDRVHYLEQVLENEREARTEERRRHDTLMAQLMQRLPELEAPATSSEARESEVSPGPTGELGEVREELDTERSRREMAESTLHEGMDEERRRREEAEQERDDLRRELHALREGPEAVEAVEEQQGRGQQPHSATGEAQESSEALGGQGSGTARGSWWRRMFGG